jgi:hypothetical protein
MLVPTTKGVAQPAIMGAGLEVRNGARSILLESAFSIPFQQRT